MVGIVSTTPNERSQAQGLAAAANAYQAIQPNIRDKGIGFWETAGLTYMQESLIGSAIRYGMSSDRYAGNYDYEAGFNPIKFYLDNKEEFSSIDHLIRQKYYDDVRSETQFRDRAKRHQTELEDRIALANSEHWGGMLMGGLASIVDVGTLIPIYGQLNKAKTLYTVGRTALAVGGIQAGQEVALHGMQDFRTLEQSQWNIGLASLMGGGLGALVTARNPSNILNPRHRWNPFNKANPITMGIKRYGQALSETTVMKPIMRGGRKVAAEANTTMEQLGIKQALDDLSTVTANGARSVGAAARKYGMDPVKSKLSDAAMWLSKAPIVGTPFGIIINARSAKAREVGLKLMDNNGILMQEFGLGQAAGRSVEDMKNLHISMVDVLLSKAIDRNIQLAEDLAKLGTTAGVVERSVVQARQFIDDLKNTGKVDHQGIHPSGSSLDDWEFHNVTNQMLMYGKLDDFTRNALISRFGDKGLQKIESAAMEQVGEINQFHKYLEDAMVDSGMIREHQRMGEAYKKAQLWEPRGIRGNTDAAEAFFLEVFAKRPSDEFLTEYNLTDDVFEKLGMEDVQVNGQTLNPDQGMLLKREILEDWAGDVWEKQIIAAEVAAEQAANEAKLARKEAVIMAAELRGSYTEIKNVSIEAAVDTVKQTQARVEGMKAERTKLVKERERLKARAQRAEEELRQTRSEVRADAQSQVKQAERAFKSVLKNQDATEAEIKAAQDDLVAKDNNLSPDNLEMDSRLAHQAKGENTRVNSEKWGRFNERVRELDRKIGALDDAIGSAGARVQKLAERIALHDAKLVAAKEAQKVAKALVKEAAKDARHLARKAKRAAKANKKMQGKPTLVAYVQDLVQKMAQQERIPKGILDSDVNVSGRARQRMLNLTEEQHRRAVQMGILNDNLYEVMARSADDIGTRLGFRENFGITKYGAEDITDVIDDIRADYNDMIAKATADGKPRVAKSLTRERDRVLEQIDGAEGRLRGTYGLPKDPDTWGRWLLQKGRQYNYIRFGAGFVLSSQTDLANVTLTSGFKTLGLRRLTRNLPLGNMHSAEVKRLAVAAERVMHSNRTLKMADIGDARAMLGIGDYGTFKHQVTSGVDRVFESLQSGVNTISGMTAWNVRLKALSMIEVQHNIAEMLLKYDTLLKAASAGDKAAELEIAKFASLGLGSEEFTRIGKMMQKHPPVKDEGIWELGYSRWWGEGKEGIRAAQDVEIALERASRRAVMTPGVGNTPLFMSKDFQKTLMQFQTYGYVYVNNFLIPATQRIGAYGDTEALLSFGLSMALGTGVVIAKDLIRYGKVKKREPEQWAYDILDRSGALAYLSVPVGALTATVSGNAPSRYYQQKNVPTLLMGPTGGLVGDLYDFATNPSLKGAHRIAPFKPLIDLGNTIFNK